MAGRWSFLAQAVRWTGRVAILLAFAAGVVCAACCGWPESSRRRCRRHRGDAMPRRLPIEGRVIAVRLIRVPLSESAVGTIRAVHETSIGSKLLARVVEVNLKAGQKVQTGDVLVRLDDTRPAGQAPAGQGGRGVGRGGPSPGGSRRETLCPTGEVQNDQPAGIRQSVGHAAIRRGRPSPRPGGRQRSAGHAGLGHHPLAHRRQRSSTRRSTSATWLRRAKCWSRSSIPSRCSLWPAFASRLTRRLQVGQSIGVQVEGLNKQCSGTVSEIVPEAQSASRSFPGESHRALPGGHLLGHVRTHPDSAWRKSRCWSFRARRCARSANWNWSRSSKNGQREPRGRSAPDGRSTTNVEVLSGLREGEQVVLPAAIRRRRRRRTHD